MMCDTELLNSITSTDSFITENLALLKPTWQSATLLTYGADRATDGEKYDLSKGGGQCVVSRSGKLTAEWRVDLESVQKIHHVFIQYVTGNRIWGTVFSFVSYIFFIMQNII